MSEDTSSGSSPSFRERLIRFYTMYNPACVVSVDSILKTYAGREGDLIKVLVAKYGPEPTGEIAPPTPPTAVPSSAPPPPPPASSTEGRRERVTRFYRHYNPEKLGELDKVLHAFRNASEEVLMANLVKKYGPEPYAVEASTTPAGTPQLGPTDPPPAASGVKVTTQSQATAVPIAMSSAEEVAAQQELLRAQRGGGGEREEPAPPTATPISPAKTGETGSAPVASPTPLAATVPEPKTVEIKQPASQLQEPPPPSPPPSSVTETKPQPTEAPPTTVLVPPKPVPVPPPPTVSHTASAPYHLPTEQELALARQPWADRFYNFYSYYRPDKLEQLPDKLAIHSGREREWMKSLVAKYGSEPPARPRVPPESARLVEAKRSTSANKTTNRSGNDGPRGTTPTQLRGRHGIPAERVPLTGASFEGRLKKLYQEEDPQFLDKVSTAAPEQREEEQEAILAYLYKRFKGKQDDPDASLQSPTPLSPEELEQAMSRALTQGTLTERLMQPTGAPPPQANYTPSTPQPQQVQGLSAAQGEEYERIIEELTFKLEEKTNEVSTLSRDKIVCLAELEAARHDVEENVKQLAMREEELIRSEKILQQLDSSRKVNDSLKVLEDEMQSQLDQKEGTVKNATSRIEQLTADSERMNGSLAVREHQLRTVRMQLEHTVEVVAQRDGRIIQLLQQADYNRATTEGLQKRVHVLELEVIPPGDPERFYDVLQDIEEGIKETTLRDRELTESDYQHQVQSMQKELQHRDRLIEQLSEQLLASATGHLTTAEADADADDAKNADDTEVNRLRTQLRVQAEEQKALITAMSLRRQPPVSNADALGISVNPVGNNSPEVMRTTLDAEIRRHVDELGILHSRLKRYEEERSIYESQISELGFEVSHWKGVASKDQSAAQVWSTAAAAPTNQSGIAAAKPKEIVPASN